VTLARDLVSLAAFLPRAFLAALRGPPPIDTLLLFLRLVTTSVPVVFVVTFFSGAMLTLQAAASLTPLGGADMAGLVVGFGGVREVFPLLACAAVAARTGAEFASELGTMKTTQQIDALEVMGVDPLRTLAGPRVLAAIFGTPICVLVACGAGMLGSQAVGAFQLGLDRGANWARLWSGVGVEDLWVGAGKGAILGFLLAAIAVREGFVAAGGAAGVGRATNRAVIRAMVIVCAASLGLTSLVYGRLL
jgi:phospholipid/cholesterol/gamma-HCH transport system permease protein